MKNWAVLCIHLSPDFLEQHQHNPIQPQRAPHGPFHYFEMAHGGLMEGCGPSNKSSTLSLPELCGTMPRMPSARPSSSPIFSYEPQRLQKPFTDNGDNDRVSLDSSYPWTSISPPQGLSITLPFSPNQPLTAHKQRRWYINTTQNFCRGLLPWRKTRLIAQFFQSSSHVVLSCIKSHTFYSLSSWHIGPTFRGRHNLGTKRRRRIY